ncbi:MAG TPA: hypothetical protein VG347_08110, partial [Verrucomicrobiae bacterium]|nr:hypothetical protein [Verrucomicrobiae bacterium]
MAEFYENLHADFHPFLLVSTEFYRFPPAFLKNMGREIHQTQDTSNDRELAPRKWTKHVSFRERLMKQLKSQQKHSKAFRKEAVELLMTGRTLT